ncbi:MAG: formylglycine-generating enzyme family protein, partial [bacterium]
MKIRIGVNLTRCNRSLIFVLLILSCKDNPTTPDVTALQITADTFTTFSGGTIQLTAVATLPDGTTSDVTTEAAWSVSPGQAGSIDQNGLFTAFNHVTGIETVEARHRSQTATAQIEVTKRASTFSISPALTNVESGRTIQFRAFATFQDGSGEFVTDQVAWSVIPGTAVEIDDKGLLTALPGMTGTETVSAEFHTLTAQSKVEVQVVYQNRFQMVEIAAGSFLMGDNDGFSDQQPEHEVFIDAFEIGKYEITNAQYAEYLN